MTIRFSLAALILLALAACGPPPGPVTHETETITADSRQDNTQIDGYASPVVVVEAAPLGTAMGETRHSAIGAGELRLPRGMRPDAAALIAYGTGQPTTGRPTEDIHFLDSRVVVEVLGEDGRPMTLYRAGHQYRLQGKTGERYEIRVDNRSREDDIIAIVTVDGLNVMTGKPARRWLFDAAMILDAGRSYNFDGFRLNRDEVAAFRFSEPGQSVAVTSGRGSAANVGVIGVAIYELRNRKRQAEVYNAMACRAGQPCAFPD
ncbi:MAG: hypothetical protein Q4G26_08030 [Paracoccus sp. (in: a-proteobacteria)]|nr:hypothetical protein [Paracoccus sp. (in: a-proteobacteria)]